MERIYTTREEAIAVPSNAYPLDTLCAACGKRWGRHLGAFCGTAHFSTFRLAVETKPAATLSDQLRKVLERGKPTPTPTLDKLENEAEKKEGPVSCTFYDEGWNAAHDGRPFNPKATRSWRDGWNDYQDADPSHKVRLDGEVAEAVRQALTTEPQRAPLDWNKSTPFDPFPGFAVSYDTGQMVEERAHPLSRISSISHMLGNGIRDEVR